MARLEPPTRGQINEALRELQTRYSDGDTMAAVFVLSYIGQPLRDGDFRTRHAAMVRAWELFAAGRSEEYPEM